MFCTQKYRVPVILVTNRFKLNNLTYYDVKIMLLGE